jgi:hypothetical protein
MKKIIHPGPLILAGIETSLTSGMKRTHFETPLQTIA